MKIFLIFFLFSVSLFAQDIITVGKGSGSYIYTVATDTNQIVNGDLYLYGNFTKTQTDTGAYSFRPYIVWKYTGGTYDSSAALRIANSFLVRVNAPILDTTGTYYASMLYKTQRGKGVWIYERGTDSTFTTPVTIVPPDTVPVQFTFTDSTGAEFSTLVESYGVKLLGLDSAYAYAGGAEFRVGVLGSWITAYTKVFGDDTLYVRNTSSAVCTTAVNTTLTVGGISDVFSVTTKLDNTPNAFIFTDVTGAEVSTLYTSNQFTLAGIYCNAAISVVGGQFQINSNAWRSSSTTVANGSLVRVRITSSANYNTAVTSVLTIGGVSDTYTVTTRADTTPTQFTFTDITNAHLDSLHTSNGVALASLDSCYGTAGLDTFKVGALGSWFVGTTKVYGGDTIYLKNVSSGSYSTAESMTFSAGGTSDTWTITTIADPTFTGNIWYVDETLTGTDNGGTSWEDAWEAFDQIAWGSVEGSDTIYVSGGTDSTTYSTTLTIGGSGASPSERIVIRNAYHSGHNGRVIIRTNASNDGITMTARDYIYIKGFEIYEAMRPIHIYTYCDYVTIDSCIIKYWNPPTDHGGIKINGNDDYPDAQNCTNITIQNCYLESKPSYPDVGKSTDIVYGQGVKTLRIYNNFIWQRTKDNGEHVDCIQLYRTADVRIWNNVCIIDSAVQGHAMILGVEDDASSNDTMVVYNNFNISQGYEGGDNPDMVQGYNRWYSNNGFAKVFWIHNTLLTVGSNMTPHGMEYQTTNLKNNIIAQFRTRDGFSPTYPLSTISGTYTPDWCTDCNPPFYIDSSKTNIIWRQWGDVSFSGDFSGNGQRGDPDGWTGWSVTFGGSTDINSDPLLTTNVTMANVDKSGGYELGSSSPAIDAGTDLEALVISWFGEYVDILGNQRDASPDIGCFEYQGE